MYEEQIDNKDTDVAQDGHQIANSLPSPTCASELKLENEFDDMFHQTPEEVLELILEYQKNPASFPTNSLINQSQVVEVTQYALSNALIVPLFHVTITLSDNFIASMLQHGNPVIMLFIQIQDQTHSVRL